MSEDQVQRTEEPYGDHPCVKCGGSAEPRWRDKTTVVSDAFSVVTIIPEHLEWECDVCAYRWRTGCKDAL